MAQSLINSFWPSLENKLFSCHDDGSRFLAYNAKFNNMQIGVWLWGLSAIRGASNGFWPSHVQPIIHLLVKAVTLMQIKCRLTWGLQFAEDSRRLSDLLTFKHSTCPFKLRPRSHRSLVAWYKFYDVILVFPAQRGLFESRFEFLPLNFLQEESVARRHAWLCKSLWLQWHGYPSGCLAAMQFLRRIARYNFSCRILDKHLRASNTCKFVTCCRFLDQLSCLDHVCLIDPIQ